MIWSNTLHFSGPVWAFICPFNNFIKLDSILQCKIVDNNKVLNDVGKWTSTILYSTLLYSYNAIYTIEE